MISFSQSIKNKLFHHSTRFFSSRSSHVSQIGQIVDLKSLTYEQLNDYATSMDIKILEENEHFHKVQLDDSSTRYIIVFHSNGQFHHIEEEYWKDLDVKFEN